jgi:hypothetical protein
MLVGIGRDHSWRVEHPVSWIESTEGKWVRRTNATKFRQFVFIELLSPAGQGIIRMQDFPYRFHDKFSGSLMSGGLLSIETAAFDVLVVAAPPATKNFRIRETWAASASAWIAQGEACAFEVLDPATNKSQTYLYKGAGLSVGLPIKKLPNLPGGLSGTGPWNDFEAPGWMTEGDFSGSAQLQTFYNLGMGSSQSRNIFDFAGDVDGNPNYLVHIDSFSTGHTFSLPSAGFSSGSMSIPQLTKDSGVRKGQL